MLSLTCLHLGMLQQNLSDDEPNFLGLLQQNRPIFKPHLCEPGHAAVEPY
jgi:hypothetical protein